MRLGRAAPFDSDIDFESKTERTLRNRFSTLFSRRQRPCWGLKTGTLWQSCLLRTMHQSACIRMTIMRKQIRRKRNQWSEYPNSFKRRQKSSLPRQYPPPCLQCRSRHPINHNATKQMLLNSGRVTTLLEVPPSTVLIVRAACVSRVDCHLFRLRNRDHR